MTTPLHRISAGPVGFRLLLASVLAVATLAACSKGEGAGPTQVIAKVNQEEITEMQVNLALQQQAGLKPDQMEAAGRKVAKALVEQEIVIQKAHELKLDREQGVVQKVEAAKRDIVARAYLDRIADGAGKPQPAEVQAYYEKNPMLFKNRRVYSFQQIDVNPSAEQRTDIENQLKSLKSPSDLEAFLKAKQIPAHADRATVAAENIPLALLERVSTLKPGQGLIVPQQQGIRIILLLGTQDSPVTEEQARPAIEAFLLNQRKRQALEAELGALRAAAKVEYLGRYADLGASAPAAAASVAAVN